MAVPESYQTWVDKLRSFIKDEADLNELLEAQENTDDFLYNCILDAMEEINWMFEPVTDYGVTDIRQGTSGLPWVIVRSGAVLQYLTGSGIHSARNTFTYSDGSGIQVNDTDPWGRYINYFNVLTTKYREMVGSLKRKRNIDDCYGGHHSEYNDLWS